ncbi:hypothetical protein [Streptomyces sp. NPDC020681]|uniref:hypothetical protein n=1 Tax=Streptomyces sp. NPDC020681 TaxID=3365083 RepID=UPI0037B79E6F
MKTTRLAVLGALTVMASAAMMPTGVAHADETHINADNGPRVGLINTGQIDDPAEDVLEHAALFGSATYAQD